MLTLSYHGHTLLGVPAVHNRVVFAEIVNRSCTNEGMRPDAVAVELDPAAVSAVAEWLEELGVISGQATLSCMLGLSRKNRRIHPRFREAALQLQEKTGRQLHEISPDLLHRELGYSAISLLCLSPTDSIIEAIRCALEMKVPLYGIDMDDSPMLVERGILNARDPVAARDNFSAYINLHGCLAEEIRDDHSNNRREIIMAARLKTLLLGYERVLFTCGLAHWKHICRLLADECLRPATDVPRHSPIIYERVLVHPHKAVQQMDLFPAITTAYEVMRQPATSHPGNSETMNFQKQFHICLEQACSRYFRLLDKERGKSRSPESNHGFGSFSGYLANLCLLSQQFTPNLYSALSVSRSMMPDDFVSALADSLMEFEWASPKAFPDLPVIGQDTCHNEKRGSKRAVMKIPHKRLDGNRTDYEISEPFYLSTLHGEEGQGITAFSWQWQDEPHATGSEGQKYELNFIWPPYENLFYASIYEAVNIADAHCSEQRAETFSGSLQDGIDLKASLRSCINGESRLIVRRTIKKVVRPVVGTPTQAVYTDQLEMQPVVFIFSLEAATSTLEWEYLQPGGSDLYEDFSSRGKRMFDKVISNRESTLIESIHFAEPQSVPKHMEPWVKSRRLLHGSVRFGNPGVNFYQSAAWLEKIRFRSIPILSRHGSFEDIVPMYLSRHHIAINLANWGNALILFALPYALATRRVVVVAPKGFQISQDVRQEARRRRVELFSLPLSHFSAERVNQIRQQYSVKAGQGGKVYPPELERIFGHNQYKYQNLLPPEIRRQARPRHSS